MTVAFGAKIGDLRLLRGRQVALVGSGSVVAPLAARGLVLGGVSRRNVPLGWLGAGLHARLEFAILRHIIAFAIRAP
jgi:hypothetical protein